MRVIEWPEFIEKWSDLPAFPPEQIFLDIGLYDIPATITAAVRSLGQQKVAFVSVHPSCVYAALAGQIDGLPRIVIKQVVEGTWPITSSYSQALRR